MNRVAEIYMGRLGCYCVQLWFLWLCWGKVNRESINAKSLMDGMRTVQCVSNWYPLSRGGWDGSNFPSPTSADARMLKENARTVQEFAAYPSEHTRKGYFHFHIPLPSLSWLLEKRREFPLLFLHYFLPASPSCSRWSRLAAVFLETADFRWILGYLHMVFDQQGKWSHSW